MATYSSHRIIIGKMIFITIALSFLNGSSSFLQVRRTAIKSRMSSKFGTIRPWSAELAALERLKKSRRLIFGNVVSTLVVSFIIEAS